MFFTIALQVAYSYCSARRMQKKFIMVRKAQCQEGISATWIWRRILWGSLLEAYSKVVVPCHEYGLDGCAILLVSIKKINSDKNWPRRRPKFVSWVASVMKIAFDVLVFLM